MAVARIDDLGLTVTSGPLLVLPWIELTARWERDGAPADIARDGEPVTLVVGVDARRDLLPHARRCAGAASGRGGRARGAGGRAARRRPGPGGPRRLAGVAARGPPRHRAPGPARQGRRPGRGPRAASRPTATSGRPSRSRPSSTASWPPRTRSRSPTRSCSPSSTSATGAPAAGRPATLVWPDGTAEEHTLDADGRLEVAQALPGPVEVSVPPADGGDASEPPAPARRRRRRRRRPHPPGPRPRRPRPDGPAHPPPPAPLRSVAMTKSYTSRVSQLVTVLVFVAAAGCAEPATSNAARAATPVIAGSAGATPGGEGTRVRLAGRWATVWGSSELASDDGRYAAARAFDRDPTTAWVEGVGGYGAADGAGEVGTRRPLDTVGGGGSGETIHVRFDGPAVFEGVALQPGFLKSAVCTREMESRPSWKSRSTADLSGRTNSRTPWLSFSRVRGNGGPDPRHDGCYHAAVSPYAAERLVVFRRPVRGTEIMVRLVRAGLGRAHEDTAISEMRPVVQGAADPMDGVVNVIRRPQASIAGADVQDLRGVSVSAYEVIDWEPQPLPDLSSPTNGGLSRPRLIAGLRDRTAREAYEAATWDHFVDYGLVVESSESGTTVTGQISDSEGDGEWVEVRPQLQVGPDGRLRSAREVVTFGAAPGCPGDVSRLVPISATSRAQPSDRLP